MSNVTIGSTAGTATGSFDVTFLAGSGTTNVSIQVQDSDGLLSSTATQTVAVASPAPTVTFSASNPISANVGDTKLYTFNVTDPRVSDTFCIVSATATDGTVSNVTMGSTAGTATGSFDVTFIDGPGTANVSVQVQDSDGTLSNTATQTVAVANVAPTVTLSASNPSSAKEGDTELYTFNVTDPGALDTFSVVSAQATDGTVSNVTMGSTAGTATGSFDVTFIDGPATSSVSIQVRDKYGADSNIATQTVAVANVAPTVTLSPSNPSSAVEGDTELYTFNVTDPGIIDTFSVLSAVATDGTVSNVTIGSTAGAATGSSPRDVHQRSRHRGGEHPGPGQGRGLQQHGDAVR